MNKSLSIIDNVIIDSKEFVSFKLGCLRSRNIIDKWNIISIAFSDGQINRWTRLDIELLLQLKSLILVEFVSSSSILLVIINDIVKINNITVPIFVTL